MAIASGASSQAHYSASDQGESTSRARRGAGFLIIFTSMALIAGLVFVAVGADGRELSRTTSNDGGAWLVNRGLSAVAHRNHATGELSSYVRVTDSPAADVYQSGDLVVVHDPSTNQLFEVDTKSFVEDLEPTQLPEFTSVLATDDAVVIMRNDPLTVWRVEQDQLPGVRDLNDLTPVISSDSAGRVAASPDGRIAAIDNESGELTWIDVDGVVSPGLMLELDGDVIDLTIVEASAVVLTTDGGIVVASEREVEHVVSWDDQTASNQAPVWLQQPSVTLDSFGPRRATSVALVTSGGEMIEISLLDDEPVLRNLGVIPGEQPVAPIVHDGCTYGVTTNPPTFGVACEEFSSRALTRAGPNLRLRLVNGWVWVNDVDSGTAYSTDRNLVFEEFDDWGPAQEVAAEEEVEEETSSAEEPDADGSLTEDPDAAGSVQDSDDFDPSEVNVPPIAIDDIARTRVDRSIIVDVLDNDIDANNDILVVTGVEPLSTGARVSVTPAGASVQVTPDAGFVGTVQFRYSISDGKSDPVVAQVIVEVLATEDNNRPPIAVTDVIATAPGHSTTVDVLRNDSDPDGDAIALAGITTETGTLRWDPVGQVTFTPDNTTDAGWIELPYTVVDDLGLETAGLLRVEIRDDGANQEPDARNDQATTITGRAVVIDLLANDSDPDGDPLIVGSQPRLLDPVGAVVQTSTTSDGEFVFRSEVPGTFIFSYTVNDAADSGSESDSARIRVDVLPALQNQPPVAVRDDVVIAAGETRTVNVLTNDGDPDGDLVSIVDWQVSDGLQVSEYNDGSGHVGFQVTVEPGLEQLPTMTYWISDGVNDPVSAPVVIAVVQRTETDQPPFANDDVIEARAGSIITGLDVLANDFDPEAGALRVVRVGDAATATVSIGVDEQSIDLVIDPDTISSFSIPYDIEDLAGNRAGAVLRVQLINADAPNRPPIARTDEARIERGQTILIDVLSNDSDPDSDLIALEAINAQPTNGVAEITDEGAVRYQPDPDFAGTDVLRYSIVDAQGDRAIGDVFIGVQEEIDANLPPIANDDSYTLAGVPSTTPLDVIANDFDPEGDPLRVIDVTSPSHGFVVVDEFGRVEYQPPVSLAQGVIATFDYVIMDTAGNQARATVSVELEAFEANPEPTPEAAAPEPEPTPEPTPEPELEPTPTPTPTPEPDRENVPPIAVNDERGPVRAGTRVEVAVLQNDRDPDGERTDLVVVGVGEGATIVGDLVVITVDEENVVVPYTIEDIDGAQSTARITVLTIENQGPAVSPLNVTTPFETAIEIDVSNQAVDPDDDDLFYVCCEDIRGGAVSNVSTGANSFRLTFTPDDEFVGQAGFNYRVDDQKGHQVSGSVVVSVTDPGNRPPVTVADTVLIPQGETVDVDLAALTSDRDNDDLTYRLVSSPGPGISVQIANATAGVTVTRAVDVGLAGSFTYEVSDGELATEGTVTVEVSEGANRPPTARNTNQDVPAAGSATVDLASLTTELDPGDFVTYSLDRDVSGAGIPISLVGSIVQISPPASAIGLTPSYTYVATDSRGASATGQINVTVIDPTSPPPSTTDDTGSTERNVVVLIDVVGNDSDPLGNGLTLTEVSAQWGTATILGNELRFNPGDRVGTSIVTYTVTDDANRSATGTATIETIGVPDQPSPPDVTRGSTEVTITWDEPASNGRPIDGYTIVSSEGGPPQVVGRQNSLTWTGLTNGLEYTFTVEAFNSVGPSIPSDPSLPITPDALPEVPSPPSATRGEGELDVTWSEPTNLGTAIDRYEVQIGPLQVPPVTVVGRLDHTWEGLTNGDFYTFTVRAHNDAGWTAWSAPSEERRPSAAPDPLTIGTTTRDTRGGALTVNWSNNSFNGAPILGYEVRSSANLTPNPVPEGDPNARSYDWSNLPPGVDMTFAVRARNEAGWSTWSDESNTMQACAVPSAPTNVTSTRGDREVALSWTAPADVQDCPVQDYIVQALQGGVLVATQNSTNTVHTFDGLTNGQLYTFQVIPSNVIGTGATSAPSPEARPAGPPICSTTSGSFNASISAPFAVDLAWSNLAANNGEPISHYEIDQGSGYQTTGSTAESITYGSLQAGTQYSYDIRAVNVVGASARCGSTSATTWGYPSSTSELPTFDSDTDELTINVFGGVSGADVPGKTWTISVRRIGDPAPMIETGSGDADGNVGVFQITESGFYDYSATACNVLGCVAHSPNTIEITLTAPPAVMTANEITLTPLLDSNVYGGNAGMTMRLAISPPADNGEPITQYVTEVAHMGRSGNWNLAWVETTNVASDPGQTVNFGEVDRYEGYSSHPNSRIGGAGGEFTWRARSKATNSKGEAEWSDWVTIFVPLPPPEVDFTVASSWNCTPSGQVEAVQCHTIRVEMYGFPTNFTYDFNSMASSTGGSLWTQSATSQAPRIEDDCQGTAPITTDQFGTVAGIEVLCLSRLGAQVRLRTWDGYLSPWHPGA